MSVDSENHARAALDSFFVAWNQADIELVRSQLNYPHITLGPAGQVIVAQSREEFRTDFERMRQVEGWHHSTIDSCTVTASSPAKVHCEVTFSRLRADGSVYGSGSVLYVFTDHGGHWGMQFRSGMPDEALASARA
jgi:hypothetical protein